MNITNEQQHAADKVKEAALLLQLMLRNAHKVGVQASVTVFTYQDSEPEVSARCYVSEEQTLSNTKEVRKKK
jgi:hypothetical protein